MQKYFVQGGPVRSQQDGDIHFVSASKLMSIYGVNPNECVISKHKLIKGNAYSILRPKSNGDYTIPKPMLFTGFIPDMYGDLILQWELISG